MVTVNHTYKWLLRIFVTEKLKPERSDSNNILDGLFNKRELSKVVGVNVRSHILTQTTDEDIEVFAPLLERSDFGEESEDLHDGLKRLKALAETDPEVEKALSFILESTYLASKRRDIEEAKSVITSVLSER